MLLCMHWATTPSSLTALPLCGCVKRTKGTIILILFWIGFCSKYYTASKRLLYCMGVIKRLWKIASMNWCSVLSVHKVRNIPFSMSGSFYPFNTSSTWSLTLELSTLSLFNVWVFLLFNTPSTQLSFSMCKCRKVLFADSMLNNISEIGYTPERVTITSRWTTSHLKWGFYIHHWRKLFQIS